MTIQSKSYMNFLGGEVSPNVYKRLDMANNGKWFETAKNIYFGTTGDIFNRRGFKYIDESSKNIDYALKLIPFVFNRNQSYCIEFGPESFSILKNGVYLKDSNSQKISVQHTGMSLTDDSDISYVQTGDILYICSKYTNRIFSIVRYAENDWRWESFNYEIPPMREINSDKDKSLSFRSESASTDEGYFIVDWTSQTSGTFIGVSVDVLISGTRTTIYTSQNTLYSIEDIASDFNSNIPSSSAFSHARVSGNSLFFYVKRNSGFSDMSDLRVKIGTGSEIFKRYTYPETFPNFTTYESHPDIGYVGYQIYEYPIITTLFDNGGGNYTLVEPKMLSITFRRFTRSTTDYLVPGEMPSNYTDYSYTWQASDNKSPLRALQEYYKQVYAPGMEWYVTSGNAQRGHYITRIQNNRNYGEYILEMSMLQTTGIDLYYSSGNRNYITSKLLYNVTANFDFFINKNIGDIFSVDCVYSPSPNGKPGENKTVSESLPTGEYTTSPFWSNGTWRFVNSGLFHGTIKLQYSYDGSEWYTHRTFSSTIRTEGGVSYGTNYNEYGTLDVDDNVLMRLKSSLTSAINLKVTLDTESYKSRSYYKIIEKSSSYPNRQATLECVKYPIGTPGITDLISNTGEYTYNSIYEWAESAWSAEYGFPKVCFYYQNRLGFASTIKDPQVIWFSRTNNFKDFSTKVEYFEDDPITISALNANGISDISWISTAKKLFVFTSDYEYGIMDEGALTQANKQLVNFTSYGSEEIEPQIISNRIIFVERGGRAARALLYDYTQENYEAIDLTIPFKHLLTNEVIVESEYIPGDYKAYLMLTSSGRILCFKYIPEQKIEACSWFKHADGYIKNICVVDNVGSYDLYVSISSDESKHLEYMHILKQESGAFLDSCKELFFSSPQSSVSDADYFVPGKKYTVISDGIVYSVIAGSEHDIVFNQPETHVIIGLPYESEATMIPPNFMYQNGTTNYNRKNMFKAHISFLDSVGFQVGVKNKDKSFKKVFALEAQSIEGQYNLYSADRSFVLQSSYLEPNMLSFVQKEPYPMHITNAEIEVDYGGK